VLIIAVSLEIIWIVVIDFANLIMQTKVTLFERLFHPFDVHVISSSSSLPLDKLNTNLSTLVRFIT